MDQGGVTHVDDPGRPPPGEPGRRVLVVDDEPTVREVAATYLRRAGYRVDEASDGDAARAALADAPDLIVLDLTLPGADGLDLLREVRRRGDVPVIVLTARGDEIDRIIGLELGADDYVVKPFSPRELTARVRSVIRRTVSSSAEAPRLDFGRLVVDLAAREVLVDGQAVETRPREFDLLAFLASSPRQVFSRGQLLHHVWSTSPEWSDISTVTVHIRRLRQRIESNPLAPRWIRTVWGVGYRFEP